MPATNLAERYTGLQAELLQIARTLIADGVAAGEIRDDIDPDNLARIIYATYVGLGLQLLFAPTDEVAALYADLDRAIDAVLGT